MWSHIGDSRVYAFSHNKVKKKTLDHSVPQMLMSAQSVCNHENVPVTIVERTQAVLVDLAASLFRNSRVYAFSHNKVKKKTLDHSVPQMLVLTREIREKDIREHPDRNKLLRVLGISGDTPGFGEQSILIYVEVPVILLLSPATDHRPCRF